MGGNIQKRCEFELLSLIVSLIYKVRAVAIGFHISLQSCLKHILVKFSEESSLPLECVIVYV